MKNKIAIAVSTILSLTLSSAFAQSGWTPTSPSGPLTTNSNTTDVNITNSLNVGTNITTTWGTVTGFNIHATENLYVDDNAQVGGSIDVAGTVKGWDSHSLGNSYVDGYLRIGNGVSLPSGYKLYVQTGILTEKIKVALSTDAVNWSDFVFADNYKLRPLNEVESFVKKNKHLPEIPSAKEVYANGLDLAQMDAKLLQKIEELTLYVIEQQKEIEQLKKKVK